MTVPYKPLSRIQKTIESLGLSITYAYDDLVFTEHNAFVLQMGEKGEIVSLFLNNELDEQARPETIKKVTEAGAKQELLITHQGHYSLKDGTGENIQINFYPISAAVNK